jgi:Mrp family chromosome partitioning ATPase
MMTALLSTEDDSGKLLADSDLIGLYRKIEMALPHQDLHIIQFISCYPGEGVTTLAREMAMLVAHILNRRTLFVDGGESIRTGDISGRHGMATLLDVVEGKAPLSDAISSRSANDNAAYDYACLARAHEIDKILPNQDKFKQILQSLSGQFKLVVINTPGALIDPASVPLGNLVDGVVLVVEAERTRSPAVKQMLNIISVTGTKLIGMVLNKRRHYIPDWLYRYI